MCFCHFPIRCPGSSAVVVDCIVFYMYRFYKMFDNFYDTDNVKLCFNNNNCFLLLRLLTIEHTLSK